MKRAIEVLPFVIAGIGLIAVGWFINPIVTAAQGVPATPPVEYPCDPLVPPPPGNTLTPTVTPTPTETPTPTATPTQNDTPPESSLQATNTHTNTIELSWVNVLDAVRYELLVWWSGLESWQLVNDQLQGNSYTHSGLEFGRTYWYTIRSIDMNGVMGDWSYPYTSVTLSEIPTATATPTPTQVDHCAGIGGDGCKFWLRNVDPADNGGGELKLLIGFVDGQRNDEVQIHGGYFVELQKDGVQVAGFDHNTRAGTNTIEGPRGRIYNYSKSIPTSQLPGGTVAGNYTIWVKDGNGERDSQNFNLYLSERQGIVWLVFDQRPK